MAIDGLLLARQRLRLFQTLEQERRKHLDTEASLENTEQSDFRVREAWVQSWLFLHIAL